MKSRVKFWVAMGTIEQLILGGGAHPRDVPIGEQHIVYSEMLMCKQSRDSLQKSLKAKRDQTSTTRLRNVPVCKKCEEAYRNHPDLGFKTWVEPKEMKNPVAHEKPIDIFELRNEQ